MVEPLILQEQVRISISLGESHFREFKSAYHGVPGAKTKRPVRDICVDISEALVAFANADGGELLIGVEDTGEMTGLHSFRPEEIDAFKWGRLLSKRTNLAFLNEINAVWFTYCPGGRLPTARAAGGGPTSTQSH